MTWGGEGRSWQAGNAPTGGQVSAVRRLVGCYAQTPAAPGERDDLRAWKALQGVKPGYGSDDLSAGTHASYQRGLISLPRGTAGAVYLLTVAKGDLHALLEDGVGLLRDRHEAVALLNDLRARSRSTTSWGSSALTTASS